MSQSATGGQFNFKDEAQKALLQFMLHEYWQLRQEIRDRLQSQRAILKGTVTAFTAILGVCATLLGIASLSVAMAELLWLVPFMFIIPSQLQYTSDQLSIIRMAKYIRLHVELPMLVIAREVRPSMPIRMPLGWEIYLLCTRLAGEMIDPKYEKHKRRDALDPDKAGTPPPPRWTFLEARWLDDPSTRRSLENAVDADRKTGKAVNWIFKMLSYISLTLCLVFCGLALINKNQVAAINQFLYPARDWPGQLIICLIPLVGIACTIKVRKLALRQNACGDTTLHWDFPSLTDTEVDKMIKQFNDDK